VAIAKPGIEWDYDPNTYFKEYGLTMLDGKWVVVHNKGKFFDVEEYEVLATVDDRKAAIGFIKLLKEQL
jgi:hypothetical protein